MAKLPEKLVYPLDYNPILKTFQEVINQLIGYLQEKEKPNPEPEEIKVGDEVASDHLEFTHKWKVHATDLVLIVSEDGALRTLDKKDLTLIRKRPKT